MKQEEATEKLFLNTLAFEFPKASETFYFSLQNYPDYPLTKLNHILFPKNIREIFPSITNNDILYASFKKEIEGFFPLEINFAAAENFALVKRHYNRDIKWYFNKLGILVETTFIKDNRIWLNTNANDKQSKFGEYDRYTIKVNFNHFLGKPELVLSYDRPSKVLKQSVAKFLESTPGTTADLFNRVVYVEYFDKGDGATSKRMSVTTYSKLKKKEDVDYDNVYPVLGHNLKFFLGLYDEEESEVYERVNRYTKYYGKIKRFYEKYLDNKDFRSIVPISEDGFSFANPMQIGQTTNQSKQLIFGKKRSGGYHTDVIPQRGVIGSLGPHRSPKNNNIQLFFIAAENQTSYANDLALYLLNGYKDFFKGLKHYTNIPITLAPKEFNIKLDNIQNPLPEVEKALENTPFNPDTKYLAIYLSPIGKYDKDREQRKIYYKVKEKLLNRNISSQWIETDKMAKVLSDDRTRNKKNFAYTLQNMAIAINAKLGGIPWRINTPVTKELVVGVGAFRHTDTNTQYIGSAFSFDNTGAFNSFEYFHHDQIAELAGSIETAIKSFTKVNNIPDRLIIHYYKDMSGKEVEVIDDVFRKLQLDIPFFVVTINKTVSEDFVVFDGENKDLLPYSGRFVNLGNQTYLLCNNTRYEDGFFNPMDGFPFPVKLKIQCPNDSVLEKDSNITTALIDQVYQFSRIYWKSVKQQNLPVTIKYPEMVAQIAPHFSGGDLPTSIGKDNLWFL